MTLERLFWHLENWRDWMKRSSSKLGYPSRSLCIASGGGSSADEFEIMCEDSDAHCASAIDSMIDSLAKPQQTAINHQWLKCSHWYPHTHEYDLEMAYMALIKLADKRGIV